MNPPPIESSISVLLVLTAVPTSARIALKIPNTSSSSSDPQQDEFTASKLKCLISQVTHIPLHELKLIFKGRIIADKPTGQVVQEFKLEDGCVIHCMGKPSETRPESHGSDENLSSTLPVTAIPPAPSSTTTNPQQEQDMPMMAVESAAAVLLQANSPNTYLTALTTLDKILENIITHPQEDKYRKVKRENPVFQRKFASLAGSDDLMKSVGFTTLVEESIQYYVLVPSAEAWTRLVTARGQLKTLIDQSNHHSSVSLSNLTTTTTSLPFPSSISSSPSFPDSRFNDILNNPQQLSAMLQDPMVQAMIQNDPRLANSIPPGMRDILRDPQRMAQIMSNPMFRQQMAHMQQQQQSAAAGGGVPAAQRSNLPTRAAENSNEDNEMTEEEMIQEAIARSLRDM